MNFIKKSILFTILACCNKFYPEEQSSSWFEAALAKLGTPGNQRIVQEKSPEEISIEQELEKNQKADYIIFLQDPKIDSFLNNNLSRFTQEIQELEKFKAMFAALVAAYNAPKNKKIVDAGFPFFQQLLQYIESNEQAQQKEQAELEKAVEPFAEAIQKGQDSYDNKQRHLNSPKNSLGKMVYDPKFETFWERNQRREAELHQMRNKRKKETAQ